MLLRDGQPVAAVVSIDDLDRADPPDPGMGGSDPLLLLCGAEPLDWFVEQVMAVYGVRGAPIASPPAPSSSGDQPALLQRTFFDAPLPQRPR